MPHDKMHSVEVVFTLGDDAEVTRAYVFNRIWLVSEPGDGTLHLRDNFNSTIVVAPGWLWYVATETDQNG